MANGNGNRPTWAALSGSWSFGDSGVDAEYTGPEEAPQPVGVALASRRLRTGRTSAEITLGDPEESAGRLLIGHNTVTGGYYSAGLGGYDRAYVIDEHVPGRGWQAVRYRGRACHLDGSRAYSVAADVRGQRLRLTVDGIPVIDQHLPHPLEGYQAGLFAWGPGPVTFRNVDWSMDRPRAFVVMQFTEPFDSLYAEVIGPVCEELQFHAYRADEVFRPGPILQDIVAGLVESDVIIAEISPTNANVFYELGYAHARNTPTVLLARRDGELPFDVSGQRIIFYDDSIAGKSEVEADLRRHLSSIVEGRSGRPPAGLAPDAVGVGDS